MKDAITPQRSVNNIGPLWATPLKTVYGVCETIRYLRHQHPGTLKVAISQQLHAQSAPIGIYDILKGFGMSLVKATGDRETTTDVNKKVEEGIDFSNVSVYEWWILAFDNQGAKATGGKSGNVGYFQSIQRLFVRITMKQLIKERIYPDPNHPNAVVLSRSNGKKWDDLILDENHRTSEITLPTADDKARAVTELLKMIDTVLQLESTGQLISYQLAEEFAREATDRQPDHKVPSWFHQSAMLESTNLAEDASIEEAEETLSRYNRTLLKANNTIADVPAEQDLNGARAAADLSNYSELARSQILEKGNQLEHDEFWRHVWPILKDFRIGLACDGEPALLLANLFREAKLAFRASWGPWHAKKRAYFAAGDILGVNYLEDVFKVAGRDTPGKLKWVLNPGDTNDVEFETTILAMAILTVASREFAKIAAESDGQGSDSVDISADEVLGHIIARAKMYPQVTMLLIHLHLFSSISILNCAEKNRSETELMTAFRSMGSFYATGHAVVYVSLLSDLCMRLECMSDAEKKLWTLTLFRKSIHGKNIFADLFVEKFVFANRAMVGRKALSNNKKRHFKGIREAALKTADESSEVRCLKMDVTREPTEGVIKSLSLGRRYCEWILYFRDLNLFGDGAIWKVKAVPFAKRKPATEYDEVTKFECCSLSGSVPSNPDSCLILSIGEKRNTAYVQTFLVDGDVHDSTWPESGDESVSLTMIDPLENRERINLKKEAKRAVSEDLDHLQKHGIYKAPEVDVAIAQLKQHLENHE